MNLMIVSRTALTFLVAAGIARSAASAQVVYTDAVVQSMTGTVNTVGPTATTSGATNWRIRGTNGGTDGASFSNEGSALQYDTNPIDASNPTLTTTISGLDASKTYEVFVFFWDDLASTPPPVLPANSPWDIAAKLSTDASYTQYDSSAGFVVTDNAGNIAGVDAAAAGYSVITFDDITGLNVLGQLTDDYTDAYDGNRAMFGALLPTQVSGLTTFAVDIQAGTNTAARSWYDGIGVREVVPEPSTFVMLCLGLAGVAVVRRRKQALNAQLVDFR
ncbi:PEP-CTERM sorting domain-containing protein [Aeoliella sp. ICT_H6.2]|uniref:PEP-CTERM sorting domain-containing protein n=1 Tax=Aeoliella straminimaris TaxID=2954799 RepID=A0A9X2FBL0_9BACT|nr:PEP-CTERM sorting domain-containing protein [Aeoliella straminimaris]MCO6045992.1 PEP-CTERM sorting domain-containing protein [Aeoliella straminimaris]